MDDTNKVIRKKNPGSTEAFAQNIEKITIKNKNYRAVIYTLPNFQLVLMSLKPGDEIGMEIHPNTTQFVRVEKGKGIAIINDITYILSDGAAVVVPPGSRHNIVNTSVDEDLKLYTIYTPPEHPSNRLQINKPDE